MKPNQAVPWAKDIFFQAFKSQNIASTLQESEKILNCCPNEKVSSKAAESLQVTIQ